MGQNYPVSYNGAAPLEYGEGASRIGVKTIALDTTTVDKEYEIGGNVLWVPTASNISATISIKYQDQVNDGITLQQGSFIAGPSFSRLYISWSAQAGETITLLYTKDTASRPFRIENAIYNFTGVTVSGTVDVLEDKASLINPELISQAAVTLTTTAAILVRAAENPSVTYGYRVSAIIQNPPANTVNIRVGHSAVSPTRGILLQPGDSIVLDTADEIYCCNVSSTTQTVDSMFIYRGL